MGRSVKICCLLISVFIAAGSVSAQENPGAARIATGQPPTLSYEDAVRLAIDNNLATLQAHERRNEARGEKEQARAPLLPNISGVAYQASLTENLVALGFQPGTIPGFNSTFLGPFKDFDARLQLMQKVFDLSAIRSYQAGRAGVRVAELQEALAREQVASRTAPFIRFLSDRRHCWLTLITSACSPSCAYSARLRLCSSKSPSSQRACGNALIRQRQRRGI